MISSRITKISLYDPLIKLSYSQYRSILANQSPLPISLGCDLKSRSGIGIFRQMYSQITSILYFSWAEIGTTGAPSAIVPGKEYLVMLKTSALSILKLSEGQECKDL